MNGKASVSKQLNAKHTKILEGLLKLPENRDCADCKSKGPRWASVNLGIFICMQCCGIHRSLGVHISKVRSATLDTWLPVQVAFIQSMGNEKSNSYWEAELPPRYDRVGIENFIRAKYVEKRWIPRDGKVKSSSPVKDERTSETRPVSGTRSAGYAKINNHISEDMKRPQLQNNSTINPSLPNGGNFVPPKLPKPINATKLQQVTSASKPQEVHQRSEPGQSEATKEKPGEKAAQVESASKVYHATDLFNSHSSEEARENYPKVSAAKREPVECISSDREATETGQTMECKVLPSVTENRTRFDSGIEELLRDFQWNTPAVAGKPGKDTKNDILNINDKPTAAMPSPVLHQQSGFLAGQSYMYAAAAPKPWPVYQSLSTGINQATINAQNWGRISNQVPGTLVQQMGSIQPLKTPAASAGLTTRVPMSPIGGISATVSRPYSTMGKPAVVPIPSGRDYDFSFLMQGMYTKR